MAHTRTLVTTHNFAVVRTARTYTANLDFDNAGTSHVFNRAQRPSYNFEINLEPLTRSEVESLQAFHFMHQGGKAFFWDGHPYNRLENYQSIAEADGARREFFTINRQIDANSFALRTLRPSTQVTSSWPSSTNGWPYSLTAVAGIVTFANSTNTIPASGDDVQAISAHTYKVVFDPEEVKVEEFARGLFRANLKLKEFAL